MAQYRKKPVVIEAIQWTGTNDAELLRLVDGSYLLGDSGQYFVVPTLEGHMRADVGDYIIKGVKDEFYPCKPDIFAATYEAVEEKEQVNDGT